MNRSDEMKVWDGVDPAQGSHKCATLAVGGDSETDLDATGGPDNSGRKLVTTPSLPSTDSRLHAFQSDRKVLHTLVHGRAIPKSQYLAHEFAIIYVRTGISMADSSPDCTRKYEVA